MPPLTKPILPKGKSDEVRKDIINGWYFNRMSMVFYLREGMIKCKKGGEKKKEKKRSKKRSSKKSKKLSKKNSPKKRKYSFW